LKKTQLFYSKTKRVFFILFSFSLIHFVTYAQFEDSDSIAIPIGDYLFFVEFLGIVLVAYKSKF
jgi:hypothetical protein